jgi:hypothetical protein
MAAAGGGVDAAVVGVGVATSSRVASNWLSRVQRPMLLLPPLPPPLSPTWMAI